MSGARDAASVSDRKPRPLVSVCLAFVCGLALGEGFFYFPASLSCAVLALLAGEAFFLRGRRLPFSRLLVGAGAFLFYQWVATPFSSGDLRLYVDQGPISLRAEVAEPPRHTQGRHRLRMKALSLQTESGWLPLQGVFQLHLSGEVLPVRYGDQLEMELRLRRPSQFHNPGAFLYADYLERRGLSGVAHLPDARTIKKRGEGGNPLLKPVYRWRERIREHILSDFSGRSAGMMLALLIGEGGSLDDELRETFIRSGAAHLLAVSGTHLAFVALMVFGLTRRILLWLPTGLLLRLSLWKIPSQWAALFTAFATTFYAFLAGGRTGTMRALTMILVYLFSIWIERARDTKSSLALAALLILALKPRALFEIAFQFSFVSVLSILLFIEWWQANANPPAAGAGLKRRLTESFRFLLLSSLSAAIGLAPLTLFYFHQFSWPGLLSNLLLLPFAGWILIPLGLSSAVVSLLMPGGFPFPGLHEDLWSLFYRLLSFFADLPGADRHFPAPSLLLILFFYLGLLIIFLKQRPRWELAAFLTACSVLFLGFGGRTLPSSHVRLSFLDVGQGDAALIEFPEGRSMLIDAGSRRAGRFAVAPFLWQKRIRRIDVLVASHFQSDHIGGIPYLLKHFEVGALWTNGTTRETQAARDLQALLRERLTVHRVISNKTPALEIGGCRIRFLNPDSEAPRQKRDPNNASIVLRMSCPKTHGPAFSALFPGDIETAVENRLLNARSELKSTVLKVPHHGSRSSSGKAFLDAVSPEIAVFSVGRRNPFGHPQASVLRRYEAVGATTYRSDREGALVIEADLQDEAPRPALKVRTERERVLERMLGPRLRLKGEWKNWRRLFKEK